jgi:hypothetical protein
MTRKKDPHAQALGRKGGRARAKKLTPKQRKEIARQGGLAKAKAAKAHDKSNRR